LCCQGQTDPGRPLGRMRCVRPAVISRTFNEPGLPGIAPSPAGGIFQLAARLHSHSVPWRLSLQSRSLRVWHESWHPVTVPPGAGDAEVRFCNPGLDSGRPSRNAQRTGSSRRAFLCGRDFPADHILSFDLPRIRIRESRRHGSMTAVFCCCTAQDLFGQHGSCAIRPLHGRRNGRLRELIGEGRRTFRLCRKNPIVAVPLARAGESVAETESVSRAVSAETSGGWRSSLEGQ
jgi:hypothetical protein